jgi:diguanylate cyclase (GGDEF)-like protein
MVDERDGADIAEEEGDLAGIWSDAETGLYNLDALTLIAEHRMRVSDRAREPISLVFLWLDALQDVRAEHGDAEAERLVREAARVVREATRDSDVVARIGEGSFCILLTGAAPGAEALVLSRLVEAVAVRRSEGDHPAPLSVSVGTAQYDPDNPAALEELLRRADAGPGTTAAKD